MIGGFRWTWNSSPASQSLRPTLPRAAALCDGLGLPLKASPGSDYFHSERINGAKHFGVWPLAEAAQACFGQGEWPKDVTVPQASVEFEVADAAAVASAAAELRDAGFDLLHDSREEPWGRRLPGCFQPKA